MDLRDRVGAVCGVLGPAAFVGAWLAGGARTPGYDPLRQAISQLAREGAPTRPLMTAGFVVFGVAVPVWAGTLARHLQVPPLRASVTVAGLATLGVAAVPLARVEGGPQDALHAVLAGTGYLAMAVSPLLGAPGLRRAGASRAAAASVAVGLVSAGCLVATLSGELSGALQRLGLTVVDAWYVALAVRILRGR